MKQLSWTRLTPAINPLRTREFILLSPPNGCTLAAMTIAYITHPDCLKHEMGRHHPECPERLGAIDDQLLSSGISGLLQHHEAPMASVEQITRVHPADHFEAI